MKPQLVVVHRPRGQNGEESFSFDHTWSLWATCLREISVSLSPSSLPEKSSRSEIYSGREAYRFLLEVVCGLKSQVVGETEVHGQFREYFEKLGASHALYETMASLHRDARKIRASYLQGLGGQSYGSIARRKVREATEIHVLGGGHLCRELLPWLLKLKRPVTVHVRSEDSKRELQRLFPDLNVRLRAENLNGAVIIAAPYKNSQLVNFLGPQVELVLDYRGEEDFQSGYFRCPYLSLKNIFSEIEETRSRIEEEVARARAAINEFAERSYKTLCG